MRVEFRYSFKILRYSKLVFHQKSSFARGAVEGLISRSETFDGFNFGSR